MTIKEFEKKMHAVLVTDEIAPHIDKDHLHNGLQTFGSGNVTKVGFGVSGSVELFRLAKEKGCDALVVHHGIMLPRRQLDLSSYKRMEFLMKNEIALWSAHFTLDAHATIGNNAQILSELGIQKTTPFDFEGAPWGRMGELSEPISVQTVFDILKPRISPDSFIYAFGPKHIQRIVVVSGGGAPRADALTWLQNNTVDLYITGEVSEWTREQIRESELNLIAGGHYHTETFGLQALQPIVESWGLYTEWIDLENSI